MAIDKENIKKMFPNLYRELEDGENKISIDALRKNPQEAEEYAQDEDKQIVTPSPKTGTTDKLRHFNPQAVDFIRRCDTTEQAEEIITYLEKRGEITKEYAAELRNKRERDGGRSFGPKKEENHYFKEGGIC